MLVSRFAIGAAAGAAVALSLVAATPAGAASATIQQLQSSQQVNFELFLPLQNTAVLDSLLQAQQTQGSPSYHKWLTPQQFHTQFGPSDAQVARVKATLAAAGLTVTQTHSRSLAVQGSANAVQQLLGTRLANVPNGNGGQRIAAQGGIVLPKALAQEGAVVVHFAPTIRMHTHAHRVAIDAKTLAAPQSRKAQNGPYWYNDLRQAYDYPSIQNFDGTGTSVAIVMASDVLDSDIKAVFDHENWSQTMNFPDPGLYEHAVLPGGAPFDPNNGASDEASLDVQQVLGGAPGAHVTLVDTPDLSDASIISAYLTIVESDQFDVVSSSFGACELFYSPAYNGGQSFYGVLDVYDELFKQGNAQGITFVASSGDSGGLGCVDLAYLSGQQGGKFIAGVEMPASSPHVTAVGGTNLITTTPPSPQTTPATLTSKYVSENANGDPELPYDPYGFINHGQPVLASGGYWGAGGGISTHFPRPAYQSLVVGFEEVKSGMRTLPDIGMQVGGCPAGITASTCDADGSRSAVVISVGGQFVGVIGTSVAAPEFASVVALGVQRFGTRLGNLNNYIYNTGYLQTLSGNAAPNLQVYHRNIPGFDGLYNADPTKQPYNFITGNGTPDVRKFLQMTNVPAAGNPQTTSNP
ncbi:MAG TPA: S53 family serine peptidase [Aliidongia sp.]|nr:S53 family serine peptidase [Aliidongia sp.]